MLMRCMLFKFCSCKYKTLFHCFSLTEFLDLGMPHDLDSDFYIKETKDMVNIVLRLIADGKC